MDIPFGKVGGLNSSGHLQPLLRYYEYSQGVEIHVAGWPPFWKHPMDIPWPYHVSDEAETRTCQFIAMEGATFVLVCTQMLTAENKDKNNLTDSPFCEAPRGGFAMIYGPDGKPLVDPLPSSEGGLLIADIDLNTIDFAKQIIDVVGHYSRPDLLSLSVNSEAAKHVNIK
jgi:nitrilase